MDDQSVTETLRLSKQEITSLKQERIDSIGACIASIALAVVCWTGWFHVDLLPMSLRAIWVVILLVLAIYLVVVIYCLNKTIRIKWRYSQEILHDNLNQRLN